MGVPHIQNFAIPKVDVSTSSTTTFDLNGEFNFTQTTNSMPWAGTIGRVLIGHAQTIGDGFIRIIVYPDGVGNPSVEGPDIPYTGGVGAAIEIIDADTAFDKDDGILIAFLGDGVTNAALRITLEVTFDFV